MSAAPHGALQQKDAEQLVRLFNVLFNSALLYGGVHPTTLKSVLPFFETLTRVLTAVASVSFVVDRESLFVEEWPVDKVVNARRMLQQFEKSGVVSVTFERDVSHNAVEKFVEHAGNSATVTRVDVLQRLLQQPPCRGIKLNYVRYGKITDDQTIVGKGEATSFSDASVTYENPAETAGSIQQIEEVLSLAHLFEHPEQSAADFARLALDPRSADGAARSLSELRKSINFDNAPSADLLLNAVYELKIDLADAIAVQRETGRLIASTSPVVEEMDRLTCDVIVKLVREEYGGGEVSLRRLAQIIRRMLPDINDLKRLLPYLKPALIDAGMSISEYLQLIRTLNVELESEALAGTLQDAASGIGASVSELVQAIRSQPDDAARLLVMASEIRKGTREDDAQLSSMLTEYIEKVSTSMALESHELDTKGNTTVLKQMLEKLEKQLLDSLRKYGVEEPVLNGVGNMLAQRFDTVFDKAAGQWIKSELGAEPHLKPHELSERLAHLLGEQTQLDRLNKPIVEALAVSGLGAGQVDELLKTLKADLLKGKSVVLPPGILSENNIQFLLEREIKQQRRYKTPFSSIMVTLEGLFADTNARRASGDEENALLVKVFSVVKHSLRDIDLIGSLGAKENRAVLALLAMTDAAGSEVVRRRLVTIMDGLIVKINNVETRIIVAVSASASSLSDKHDLKSYLAMARRNHESVVHGIVEKYRL